MQPGKSLAQTARNAGQERVLLKKTGSLSNGVDDLENFTSEMEWSFFVPVGFSCVFSNWYSYISTPPAFPEVIKIPESKATAFQTLDSAVYSFNRTVGEIILDAVKNSYHVLLKGGDSCVHVLTRTTVVFQNINGPLPNCLRQSVFKNSHDVMTYFSVAADE